MTQFAHVSRHTMEPRTENKNPSFEKTVRIIWAHICGKNCLNDIEEKKIVKFGP